ncbi:ShlB/FhaC/HecB family hemolysin secretion/activation protein [Piscinibacter sakaiensis]|uniref:ShlB/FhaC/HecB family hemolysin secretion/activation protein n=1 Tax=Piscinibacter sakaiensis TaxID=1547922 RepID=UPI003AAE408A
MKRSRAGLAACLMLPLAVAAGAAETGSLLAQAAPGQPAARPPAGVFQLPPLPGVALPPRSANEPVALELKAVRFAGNTAIPTAELDALVAPHIGRSLAAGEIEALRIELTRLYVDRGFVNSGLRVAGIDAANGVLSFNVIEGRLQAIELQGMDGLDDAYITAQLHSANDGPLNLDRLRERFQLLLADPLFERLNARLLPGDSPGEAVLAIDVRRARPYELRLFANNHRPVSIGAATLGIAGVLRNGTGRGDVLEATLQSPAEGGGDLRGSVAWRMPLDYRGTHLSLSLDHGESSVVEQSVRSLDISSRLSSVELGLSRVVTESLDRRLSLGVAVVHRENRTWLLGRPFSFNPGEPDGIVREDIARFWQELVLRSQTQVLALRSTFSWGRNNLQDVAGLPVQNRPPSNYRIWLGQAQYARRIGSKGAQLVARATVQHSPDRLLALDGIALGGASSVRGYRENQLVRDEGVLLNLEFEWPAIVRPEIGLRLALVPFYDIGRGRNHGQTGTTLRSVGLATRLRWKALSVDLVLARRIDAPALARNQGSNLQDDGVHLQLSWQF